MSSMINHDGTINTQQAPRVSQGDKLLFCLFLALAFHAMLLFGLGFEIPDFSASSVHKSFDVVLAQYPSEKRPDKAHFIGQADQEGGGDAEDIVAPSAREKALFNNPNSEPTEFAQQQPVSSRRAPQTDILHTSGGNDMLLKAEVEPNKAEQIPDTASLIQRSYEIDGLIANLDRDTVNRATKARKRQVSAAIHRASDALYLDTWRRRIETVGNQNYPEKARQLGIYGSLTLKVAINANGTINEVKIMRSSGKKLLDDAAIRIVRLAAPFPPLSEEMRKDTDVLEIIRVWNFEPGNTIRTH